MRTTKNNCTAIFRVLRFVLEPKIKAMFDDKIGNEIIKQCLKRVLHSFVATK